MRRPRQPGSLRPLIKRALLCLVLGAVLQYLVAAAFSLAQPPVTPRRAWSLQIKHDDGTAGIEVMEFASAGTAILETNFGWVLAAPGELPGFDALDWSERRWKASTTQALLDPMTAPQWEQSAQPPPAWSRMAQLDSAEVCEHLKSLFVHGSIWEVASGWPMHSATYLASELSGHRGFVVQEGAEMSSTMSEDSGMTRVIPLNIYWPGAIINTLTYAAALFVPLTLIAMTRRHLRGRAGRCPHCGYDLRATTTGICPECGVAVTG